MRIFASFSLVLVLALLIGTNGANASIKNRNYSLHLDLYGIQPALSDSAQIWLFSPYIGGDLQVMLSQQVGLMFSFRHGKVDNDSVSTSIFKVNNDRANRRWRINSISIGPKFYLNQRKGTTPFFVTRLEMMFWNVKTVPGEDYVVVQDEAGNPHDLKATEIGFTTGLGFEQLFADRFAISLSAEFTYLTGIGTDFAQWVKNSRSRGLLQFGIGVSVHFGKKHRSMLDEEENDSSDPARINRKVYEMDPEQESKDDGALTPVETPVRRAVIDSDSDGVIDAIDKCVNSPQGAMVGSDGCPTDTDHDGVYDGIDKCGETPPDDIIHVDSTGCTPDSDVDGVPDYRDKCSGTAENIPVDSIGCDRDLDKDGVANSQDQCPNTPHDVPVDSLGCPDLETIFAKRIYHDLFNSGESKIIAGKSDGLDSLVTLLQLYKTVSATVYAYTDDIGPEGGNIQISQKRADAVASYLIKRGIGKGRVRSVGRGESNFLASNRTRSGREANRRIEIEFKFK